MSLKLTASDEELRNQFSALQTRADIAKLLDIEESRLIYHLYVVPPNKRYRSFQISKRSGGTRGILAPATALKIIQQKLNQVLQVAYKPKPQAHGFLPGKSIVTNARIHPKQKFILNVDIRDFFPSINFGRVRGMFMAAPYTLSPEVATILAQVCCFNNQLPQGAPTSPIVSNMICAKMDSQLLRLAQEHRCIYTRYADDLTFSTSMPYFPTALARYSDRTGQVELGEQLIQVIHGNGFEINANKIRLQTKKQRQEVTGLTVNKFPNVKRRLIRQIRAMLHAWKEYGLEAAESEFHNKYDKKHRSPNRKKPAFKKVILGKVEFLGMVRGKDDPIYLRFRNILHDRDPDLVKNRVVPSLTEESFTHTLLRPLVITEGKTDWKHLKNAIQHIKEASQSSDLQVEFKEYEDDNQMGGPKLKEFCAQASLVQQMQTTIAIFDRDDPEILRQVTVPGQPYKHWGHNVYSFAIPIPDHRTDTPNISIEFYYTDDEIRQPDSKGRRLYISTEFNPRSDKHSIDPQVNCTELNKIGSARIAVIDNRVFNAANENVALPKSDFADYVLNRAPGFDRFDVSEFRKIFDVIEQILRAHMSRQST